MKIQQLLESGRINQLTNALAMAIMQEVDHEARVKLDTQQLHSDESMRFTEAKKKLTEIREKIEVELYHLIF